LAASPDSAPVREYDFHLLRDPETVNAFALPGGQIFITAALLGRLGDARLYPNGQPAGLGRGDAARFAAVKSRL
jgi:hypothetical protein